MRDDQVPHQLPVRGSRAVRDSRGLSTAPLCDPEVRFGIRIIRVHGEGCPRPVLDDLPVEPLDAFIGLIQQAVNLALDTLAGHACSSPLCLSACPKEGCIFISRNSVMANSRCSNASGFSSG